MKKLYAAVNHGHGRINCRISIDEVDSSGRYINQIAYWWRGPSGGKAALARLRELCAEDNADIFSDKIVKLL